MSTQGIKKESPETFSDFIRWEQSQRTIDFKIIYCDMAQDTLGGLMLSQIVYFWLPDREGYRKPRAAIDPDGTEWIACKSEYWWNNCRLTDKQVPRLLDILKEKGLIDTSLRKFGGVPTVHISLKMDQFMLSLNHHIWSNPYADKFTFKDREAVVPKGAKFPDPSNRKVWILPDRQNPNADDPTLPIRQNGLYQLGKMDFAYQAESYNKSYPIQDLEDLDLDLNTFSPIPADGNDICTEKGSPIPLAAEQPGTYLGQEIPSPVFATGPLEIPSSKQPFGSEQSPPHVPATPPKVRKPKIKPVLPFHNPSGFKRAWDAHNVGKRIDAVPVWDALYQTPLMDDETGLPVVDGEGQPVMVLNDATVEKIITFCKNAWDIDWQYRQTGKIQHFCRWLENYGWTEVIHKPRTGNARSGGHIDVSAAAGHHLSDDAIFSFLNDRKSKKMENQNDI